MAWTPDQPLVSLKDVHKTFGALDADRQAAFSREVMALMESRNRARDGTLVLPSEYLEVVIERQ